MTGATFTQNGPSGTVLTPQQSYSYDANGNVLCYGNGVGAYALQYDALNRRTVVADPDDGSGACGNPISADRDASYTAYFPDGSVMFTETPVQHAASVAAGTPGSAGHDFTYDLDGDKLTETFPTPSGGAHTVFQDWYDGDDRLVEVRHGLTTRYLYDLSQGGTVSVTDSAPFRAYGNLYARMVASGTTSSPWTEQDATAYDALDRRVMIFRYAYNCPACAPLNAKTNIYDDPSTGLGLLASTTDETGIKTSYSYDALGRDTAIAFSDDGGVTPARQFSYDADGNVTARTSAAFGTEQLSYDALRHLQQRSEGNASTSPAIYQYSYNPDGSKASVSFQSTAITGNITYAYRADGKRVSLATSWNGQAVTLGWTYTAAGRELSQTDPWGAKSETYGPNGLRSSLSVPAGSFTNLQYDNEGNLVGHNAYGLTTTRSYDGTNELLTDNNNPPGENCPVPQLPYPPSWAAYTYSNGAMISSRTNSPNCSNNTLSGSSMTAVNDPRMGAVGFQAVPLIQPSPPPKYAGSCSNTPKPSKNTTYNYDGAGRVTSSKVVLAQFQQTGICIFDPVTTTSASTSTYDAEGHELQYATTTGSTTVVTDTMQWGVNGHPSSIVYSGQTLSLHWDGDNLLFASDNTGALEQFNVEQSLVSQMGSTPIVTDRDMSGTRVSEHGASGTDGLCIQPAYGGKAQARRLPRQSAAPSPGSSGRWFTTALTASKSGTARCKDAAPTMRPWPSGPCLTHTRARWTTHPRNAPTCGIETAHIRTAIRADMFRASRTPGPLSDMVGTTNSRGEGMRPSLPAM